MATKKSKIVYRDIMVTMQEPDMLKLVKAASENSVSTNEFCGNILKNYLERR